MSNALFKGILKAWKSLTELKHTKTKEPSLPSHLILHLCMRFSNSKSGCCAKLVLPWSAHIFRDRIQKALPGPNPELSYAKVPRLDGSSQVGLFVWLEPQLEGTQKSA